MNKIVQLCLFLLMPYLSFSAFGGSKLRDKDVRRGFRLDSRRNEQKGKREAMVMKARLKQGGGQAKGLAEVQATMEVIKDLESERAQYEKKLKLLVPLQKNNREKVERILTLKIESINREIKSLGEDIDIAIKWMDDSNNFPEEDDDDL